MQHIKRIVALLTLFCVIVSAGCATLFTGTSDNVNVTTEPSGAKIYIDGQYMGAAPVTSSLKRDKDHFIVAKSEGYQDASANISRSFNAVAILNLVGILCWVVDIVTGAMWKFDRNAVTITLEKETKKTGSVAPNSRVVAGADLTAVPYLGKVALLLNAHPAH